MGLAVLLAALAVLASTCSANTDVSSHAINNFGSQLYDELVSSTPDNSLCLAPVSVASALAMLYAGTAGDSEAQMRDVLQFESHAEDDIHSSFGALDSALVPDADNQFELDLANRLYGDNAFQIKDAFLNTIRTHYGGDLQRVDFREAAEASRVIINDWVSDQTNGKIPELLQQGTVDANTVLVVVNAIYFKGTWKHPFNETFTAQETFTSPTGAPHDVDMMRQERSFKYVAADRSGELNSQIIELPYEGEDVSMVIVLPSSDSSLAELEEEGLPLTDIITQINSAGTSTVDLRMPKFTLEQEMFLREMLIAMNMRDVFNPSDADLTGISDTADIFLTEVVHKTYIEVNEQGTEAAAATGGMVGITMVTPQMYINRPFFYMILHKPTNTALFIGRYMGAAGDVSADPIGRFYTTEVLDHIDTRGGAATTAAHPLLLLAILAMFTIFSC